MGGSGWVSTAPVGHPSNVGRPKPLQIPAAHPSPGQFNSIAYPSTGLNAPDVGAQRLRSSACGSWLGGAHAITIGQRQTLFHCPSSLKAKKGQEAIVAAVKGQGKAARWGPALGLGVLRANGKPGDLVLGLRLWGLGLIPHAAGSGSFSPAADLRKTLCIAVAVGSGLNEDAAFRAACSTDLRPEPPRPFSDSAPSAPRGSPIVPPPLVKQRGMMQNNDPVAAKARGISIFPSVGKKESDRNHELHHRRHPCSADSR
jgi:hypothetical protein